MTFSDLTQIGLLGTGRQTPPPAADTGTPLTRLQAQLDPLQREQTLLGLAALTGLHQRIGTLPASDQLPGPTPCPSETKQRINDRANGQLLRLLSGDYPQLLPEWLKLAAQSDRIAQPEALPQLLSLGATKSDLRAAIVPILGERGSWLAAHNQDWAWVSGAVTENEDIWQTGEPTARLSFLARLRQTNPQQARELLTESWAKESPDDRAAFATTLGTSLGPDDESFLEAALDDKRKEVRRVAATLLSRLPESGLVKRMFARIQPLLRYTPATAGSVLKLKKATPAALDITLPAECDKAMQRDGIEPKPIGTIGEKIWWLVQMLEAVPLDFWTTEWKVTPAEIITASGAGEWEKELFEAWTRAAIRQKNGAWAAELLALAVRTKHFNKLEGLTGAMSAGQCERAFAPLLAADDGKTGEIQAPLLAGHRQPWSPDFSRAALAWMRKITGQSSTDWQLRSRFKDFAQFLAPETLAEAATGWPTGTEPWENFWSKGVEELLAITQFRSEFHSALNPNS